MPDFQNMSAAARCRWALKGTEWTAGAVCGAISGIEDDYGVQLTRSIKHPVVYVKVGLIRATPAHKLRELLETEIAIATATKD